jgi:DNA invertase Pin-like site-specific DNA recombinase
MLIDYARVSTDQQDRALQLDALSRLPKRIFIETASGTKTDRPELAKALEHAPPGGCLCHLASVPCHTLAEASDRPRRADSAATNRIEIAKNIDTTTPAGRSLFHVLGALAQVKRPRTLRGQGEFPDCDPQGKVNGL